MAIIRSKAIKDSARGEPCTMRLYPHCDGGGETTVWGHLPTSRKGMALKSSDLVGVYTCHFCHMVMDGQYSTDISREEILRVSIDALDRTFDRLIEKGLVFAKKDPTPRHR